MINSGELDKRITILRAGAHDDGFATVDGEFMPAPLGKNGKLWARKRDVSDAEQVRAAEQGAVVTARFVIRATGETRTITPKDRLVYHGKGGDQSFNITGVKEVDDDGLELSTEARSDTPKENPDG